MFLKTIKLKKDQIPDYSEYPFSIPFIRHMNELDVDVPVTFFVGENGAGKSTLLEAIADQIGFNPAGVVHKIIRRMRCMKLNLRLENL